MPEDKSPAQLRLEMANRAIRYVGIIARDAPKIVARELGLLAEEKVPPTLQFDWVSLPRDTGVRVRVTPDRLQLGEMWPRRWWQFWRPRWSLQILAEKPYAIKAGDVVQLMQQMWIYTVTVNEVEVLRYPPEEGKTS